jgi:hypothetical protein
LNLLISPFNKTIKNIFMLSAVLSVYFYSNMSNTFYQAARREMRARGLDPTASRTSAGKRGSEWWLKKPKTRLFNPFIFPHFPRIFPLTPIPSGNRPFF